MQQEQKQTTLPASIDKEVLAVVSQVSNVLQGVSEGWSMLSDTIRKQAEKIKELESLLEKGEELDVSESN